MEAGDFVSGCIANGSSDCACISNVFSAAEGAAFEEAPFLSEEQKRDILYDNAARFLRLTAEQIDAHRRLGQPAL